MSLLSGAGYPVRIRPAAMALAPEQWGGRPLRAFQAQLARAEAPFVAVEAPTGAGKTLGFLLRFLQMAERAPQGTAPGALLVYPTNQLIVDQAQQVAQYLRGLGLIVRVFPDEEPAGIASNSAAATAQRAGAHGNAVADPDVVVMVASGQSLAAAAQEKGRDPLAKGSVLRRGFDLHARRGKILLTNPDTLWLIAHSWYHQSESLYRDLMDYRLLVLDEFHLYTGVSLLHLTFLLHLLQLVPGPRETSAGGGHRARGQVIVSSATHSPALDLLTQVLGPPVKVTAPLFPVGEEPGQTGATAVVRQPVEMQIRFLPHRPGWREGDAKELAQLVVLLYQEVRENPAPTKVVAIFDSVVLAHAVYREAKKELGAERVSAITGLVPASAREYREVIIGTSTIEVGIDFHAAAALFTATDSGSFLQRLGRIGRHSPGRAVALIPREWYDLIEQLGFGGSPAEGPGRAPETVELDHAALVAAVQQSLPDQRAYEEFAGSLQAAILLRGFLRSFLSLEGHRRPLAPEQLAKWLEAEWERLVPPFLSREVMAEAAAEKLFTVEKAVIGTGFRGDILTVPARYAVEERDGPKGSGASQKAVERDRGKKWVEGSISILDLHKVEGRLVRERDGYWVEVHDIKDSKRGWSLYTTGNSLADLGPQDYPGVVNPKVVSVATLDRDDDLRRMLRGVLYGRVHYRSTRLVDWRLSWAPGERSGAGRARYYLGADALLAWYLDEAAGAADW